MDLQDVFYIDEKDWYKLQAWAGLAYDEDKNEISGLMTALPQKDGRIKISDVEILKQENTGANTELDGDAVSAYMMKYGMKYNNPDMKFVWWHSHHTMGAFWSGTDIKEIEAWENNSYSLALVINLKEEYVFRISFWKTNGLPIEKHIDTTLTIERDKPKVVVTDNMKKTYEELCSSPQMVTTYGNGWGHNRSYIPKQHNPNQTNIWHREEQLTMEAAYMQAVEKAEEMQDAFMEGGISFNVWKQEVAKINKTCIENKLPFKMIVWKLNKAQLTDKLMTILPAELFEWDDENSKGRAETIAWNDSFGGYNVY